MDTNGLNAKGNLLELKDIAVSAFLFSTEQVKLIGKRRLSSGEVLFQFFPKEKAEQLTQDYWNLKAPTIQPKKLFSAQRDLKDMIFGGQQ